MKVLTIAPCKESFIISIKRVSHFCTRLAHGDNLIPFSDIDIILEGLIDLKNELKSCRDMMEQEEFDSHMKLIEDLQRLILSRRKSFQDKENKRTEQVEVLQAKPSSVFTEGSDLLTQNTRENTQSAFMEVRDEFSREENGSVQSMQTLMLQQKGLSAMEVDQEIKNHNKLTAELAELTTLLKESTLTMSESISTQNHV